MHGCEASVRPLVDGMHVVSRVGIVKPRLAFVYSNDVVRSNIMFYNNTLSVVIRGLAERLYLVKSKDGFVPCPRPVVSFETLSYFSTAIRRNMPSIPSVWTAEEFVQSYTGRWRKRYAAAADTFAMRGIRRQDGYLSTFIKAELYNGTLKNNPCPRLIQPRSPVYNLAIGRYLRPAEKLFYKAIDRVFGHHVVLKCDNMFKRAECIAQYWHHFKNPCFVGLDASRFDQHVSAEALEFEHGIYNRIFRDPDLARWLSWQVDQVGYANMQDGMVRYQVRGCRASGDMNTALGNVIIMCAVTHHYLRDLGVDFRFINDGDDCGIFLEAEHVHLLDNLPAHHLEYGFEMEVEDPVYTIEHIEFCQCHPVELQPGVYMMVRNIHKAMLHDWVCITAQDWCSVEENLVATARCGLSLYAGVPVLDEMYQAMARFPVRENVVARILEEAFSGSGRTWRLFASEHRMFPVDETVARVSMHRAFGILPDMQVELERIYRAFNSSELKEKLPILPYCADRVQYILE